MEGRLTTTVRVSAFGNWDAGNWLKTKPRCSGTTSWFGWPKVLELRQYRSLGITVGMQPQTQYLHIPRT